MAHNLPVNSLEVIGWVPCGVKEHNHIGAHEIKAKTTRPEGTKSQLSADSRYNISKYENWGNTAPVIVIVWLTWWKPGRGWRERSCWTLWQSGLSLWLWWLRPTGCSPAPLPCSSSPAHPTADRVKSQRTIQKGSKHTNQPRKTLTALHASCEFTHRRGRGFPNTREENVE